MRTQDIVAWGAGKLFDEVSDLIKVNYIVDNNAELWNKIHKTGLPIYSPDTLKGKSNIKIIICVSNYNERAVIEQIQEMQLCSIDIIPFREEVYRLDFVNKIAFSLFSEDLILHSYIEYYKKKRIRHYIDLGVNHPIIGNATIKFYYEGATGCLVEPNPDYKTLINVYRPKDILMGCGCTSKVNSGKSIEYYEIINFDTRNTFSREWAEKYREEGYDILVREIPVYSLNHIIEQYDERVDYISIDTEGLEEEMLYDFDFSKYDITYFNIEKSSDSIVDIMLKNGYKVIAETVSNWIFEKGEE